MPVCLESFSSWAPISATPSMLSTSFSTPKPASMSSPALLAREVYWAMRRFRLSRLSPERRTLSCSELKRPDASAAPLPVPPSSARRPASSTFALAAAAAEACSCGSRLDCAASPPARIWSARLRVSALKARSSDCASAIFVWRSVTSAVTLTEREVMRSACPRQRAEAQRSSGALRAGHQPRQRVLAWFDLRLYFGHAFLRSCAIGG